VNAILNHDKELANHDKQLHKKETKPNKE